MLRPARIPKPERRSLSEMQEEQGNRRPAPAYAVTACGRGTSRHGFCRQRSSGTPSAARAKPFKDIWRSPVASDIEPWHKYRPAYRRSRPFRVVRGLCQRRVDGKFRYKDGEDKRRIHAAGNHFILSRSQRCFITAEMISDGFAVDDRSKRAAEVAHIVIFVALLDHEMIARQSERGGVIEFEIWMQRRQPFPCNRPPANDERQKKIAELERTLELSPQPRILCSEIIID